MTPWRRRRADPLGDGVWRRAHDRYRRAVDRYHQVIASVPDGPLRDRLELVAIDLAELLGVVRSLCERAQVEAPSSGLEVPGGGATGDAPDLHRRLSQAAHLAAQAAEAGTMARVSQRSGRDDEALRHAAAAERVASAVRALVTR